MNEREFKQLLRDKYADQFQLTATGKIRHREVSDLGGTLPVRLWCFSVSRASISPSTGTAATSELCASGSHTGCPALSPAM